jgi:hypothetical protein
VARNFISCLSKDRTVLLNRILDLKDRDDVFLAEESLGDLITLPVTSELLSSGIEADEAIELVGGYGMAFHLKEPADFWLLLTDKYSTMKILEGFRLEHDNISWKTAKTSDGEFFEAVAEYFSLSLAGELFCESCEVQDGPFYIEERVHRLESFLSSIIPRDVSILEVACGNGMASQSLHRLGFGPFTMELDRCEMCQGLKAGKLEPNRSFVLDARLLNRFFKPGSFDVVVGFMVGLIEQVNWNMWGEILLTASNLASRMILYTVYTRKEAELIARALDEAGWDASLIDNRDASGIYDQWAVQAERKVDGKVNTTSDNDEVW